MSLNGKPFALFILIGLILLLLVVKGLRLGWFETHQPLELPDSPALLFFNVERGCECQMIVSRNADAQMDNFIKAASTAIPIYRFNLERRRDLARQYHVVRAPTLILLNTQGAIVWRQDDVITDEQPLNIQEVEARMAFGLDGIKTSDERSSLRRNPSVWEVR